jgi:hypothetical protein
MSYDVARASSSESRLERAARRIRSTAAFTKSSNANYLILNKPARVTYGALLSTFLHARACMYTRMQMRGTRFQASAREGLIPAIRINARGETRKDEAMKFVKGHLILIVRRRTRPADATRESHYLQSVYCIRDCITKLQFYCRAAPRRAATRHGPAKITFQREKGERPTEREEQRAYVSPRGAPECARSKSFVKSLVSPDGIIPP